MKKLTNEDIAELYKEKTGDTAYTRPMEAVYEWATKQPEITVNKDTTLSWAEK